MNVRDLIHKLHEYPLDMEILYSCCSDYEGLDAEDLTTVKAVDRGGYWMRSHATMSDENKALEKTYLLFPGN